ncbi:hypothetical protein HDU91_005872, partial [Kappamyces sp. JEL0680]
MLETPYVVKFRDIYELAEPQQLWEFHHPNRTTMYPNGHPDFNSHNTRYAHASFAITQDALLHGFSAYFECTLYKD